jgi:hypothetical protein
MARILTGVLLFALTLVVVGCGSSSPMRFEFKVPSGTADIDIDDGDEAGTSADVFELDTNDVGKKLRFDWNGQTFYGKMDVYNHTALTRMSVVRVQITGDMVQAIKDYKVVTYVIYERYRDANVRGSAGEDSQMRVYDYGDSVTRDALIEQASLNGTVIAVIDFGNAEYLAP